MMTSFPQGARRPSAAPRDTQLPMMEDDDTRKMEDNEMNLLDVA